MRSGSPLLSRSVWMRTLTGFDISLLILDSILSQIRINPESRAYYERKIKEGKTHWQAMNALSRQLIKIIYYMLKNNEPYRREPLVN
jgi:hypothetical protein